MDSSKPESASKPAAKSHGQPSKRDSSQPESVAKSASKADGQTSKTDSSQPESVAKSASKADGQTSKTDSSQPESVPNPAAESQGQSSKMDSSQPESASKLDGTSSKADGSKPDSAPKAASKSGYSSQYCYGPGRKLPGERKFNTGQKSIPPLKSKRPGKLESAPAKAKPLLYCEKNKSSQGDTNYGQIGYQQPNRSNSEKTASNPNKRVVKTVTTYEIDSDDQPEMALPVGSKTPEKSRKEDRSRSKRSYKRRYKCIRRCKHRCTRRHWGCRLAILLVVLFLVLVVLVLLTVVGDVDVPVLTKVLRDNNDKISAGISTILPASGAVYNSTGVCNNHSNLCDVRVNEMAFAMTHASKLTLDHDLEQGYRGIHFDLAKCDHSAEVVLSVERGNCSADFRAAFPIWYDLVSFIEDNPQEILLVSMNIKESDSDDEVSLGELVSLLSEVAGLSDVLYEHSGPGHPWPTLDTMIRSNKRVVLFLYEREEFCSKGIGCGDYIHDWFTYAVETSIPFQATDDLSDAVEACSLDLGSNGRKDFYAIDMSQQPSTGQSCEYLGNATSLLTGISECGNKQALQPNLIRLDCDTKDVILEITKDLNSALTPTNQTSAIVVLEVLGPVVSMASTVLNNFESVCIAFFDEKLPNITNVDCEVKHQNVVISKRRNLQGFTAGSILEATVRVSGDVEGDNNLTPNHLEILVINSAAALQSSLIAQDVFFASVSSLNVLASETVSLSTFPSQTHQSGPTMSPNAGAAPAPSSEFTIAPTRESIAIPLTAKTLAPTPVEIPPSTGAPTAQSTGGIVVLEEPIRLSMAPHASSVNHNNSIREEIVSAVGVGKFTDAGGTSYDRALDWILNHDRIETTAAAPNIIQRFMAAYFYFETSLLRRWSSCGEARPENFDDPIACTYKNVVNIQPFTTYDVFAKRWLSPVDECMWIGIECDEDKHIVSIELSGMNMTGSFPEGIQFFTFLETLSLPYGELSGTLPKTAFSKMDTLKHLNLQYNKFSGPFPPAVLELTTNLQSLQLSRNKFTGTIPNEIGQMTDLQLLHVNHNFFSGPIPSTMSSLQSLVELWMQANFLTSTLPVLISNLRSLKDLKFYDNKLHGTLPTEMFQLPLLHRLDVSFNQFTGTIPSQIGQLGELYFLYINDNQLTGSVPTELGSLSQLNGFHLALNNLTGSMPFEMCALRATKLTELEADCLTLEDGSTEMRCDCCTSCCNVNDVCAFGL